ncbi:hypothetical protein BJF85_10650 [Saccharomonospora sp. CUA-673]|uniref:hypothetical protein n=1 Tax=Saccharomonospora sp. CUA-673 TaxID=1904969 RepID=UPI00095D41B9|nr:hypothetical protein [Saccharomonospora sp. CUA-673]OLT48928.1 hypothetical protein BJF85_10650 [Saccharomonospora sp. CUA-673]
MPAELLVYAAIFVFPSVAVTLIVTTPGLVRRAASAALRRRRLGGGPVAPGRPVEHIAADLRRARRALENLETDASRFHRQEAHERYDGLLTEACAAAGIASDILDDSAGLDRDIARLMLEDALIEHGLAPH